MRRASRAQFDRPFGGVTLFGHDRLAGDAHLPRVRYLPIALLDPLHGLDEHHMRLLAN